MSRVLVTLSWLFAATDMPSAPNALAGTQAVTNTAPDLPTSGAVKVILVVTVAIGSVMTPAVTPVVATENGTGLKVAVTLFAASMVRLHDPVPVQAPLQPAKVLPPAGIAVRVTLVPPA